MRDGSRCCFLYHPLPALIIIFRSGRVSTSATSRTLSDRPTPQIYPQWSGVQPSGEAKIARPHGQYNPKCVATDEPNISLDVDMSKK